MITIYDVEVKDINLKTINMDLYRGKILLIVNVASACGFTPQYKGLQEIYDKYKDKGFEILAFPCNQFGAQESGTNNEIAEFCDNNLMLHLSFLTR
jgi:glutathione peroxidase